MKRKWCLGIPLAVILGWAGVAHAQWTAVAGAPSASTCLLLTDGTVICQEGEEAHSWRRLTPDQNGNYATGAWTSIASLKPEFGPLYYASAVLADGRVVLVGGEYNSGTPNCPSNPGCQVNLGAIYDPIANTWTDVTAPWPNVGDGDAIVLADGRFILRHLFSTAIAQFNPATNDFTLLNATGKADNNSEEGSTLLPNGTFLNVDAGTQGGTGSQIYNPTTNAWTSAGSTVASLPDNGGMGIVPELGPSLLRPDGTVVWFGATAHNAIYDSTSNPAAWSAGPDYPLVGGTQQLMFDAPASLLPNGNIFVVTSDVFAGPYHIFEFRSDNTFSPQVTDPPGNGPASFQARTLLLPTGQVLLTNGSSTVQLYTPGGTFQDAWRPVITSAPKSVDPGTNYTISGRQFNGLSQASAYGDDAQMATNYPLVRIINRATGHVFYARTHNHSSMGVATGTANVSTQFDTPAGMETGLSDLQVVANGIPSFNWVVNGPGLTLTGPLSLESCAGTSATTTLNVCNTGKQDLVISNITSSSTLVSVTDPGYSLVISPDFCFPFQVTYNPSAPGTTNATLTIASNDPNTPSASVQVTANAPPPRIGAVLVNAGVFANTCPGSLSDAPVLTVTNQGDCNLVISSIGSSNVDFLVPTADLPLTVGPHATVPLPVRFQPAGLSCSNTVARAGTITINSNDPVTPALARNVSGLVPCPSINAIIANSGSFGNVCAGNQSDLNLQLLNQGQCNLNITSLTATPGSNFEVPSLTQPLVLSHDANATLPIRFKPNGTCSDTVAQTSSITINSNDPANAVLVKNVSGIEGCPKIVLSPTDLNGIYAFPATVSDPTGNLGCFTDRQISIGNAGTCPLKITNLSAGPSNTFNVINPSLPLTIGPGAASAPVTIRFRPTDLTGQVNNVPDQQTGTLAITSNDPVGPSANLCGEPAVRSGIRLLVTDAASAPYTLVDSITLSSKGLSPGVMQKLTNVPLFTASSICGKTIRYHLDNETLAPAGTTGSNPRSSYALAVKVGGKPGSMSFVLGQCEVKEIVLKIK